MTVQELIDKLNTIQNKELPVVLFDGDFYKMFEFDNVKIEMAIHKSVFYPNAGKNFSHFEQTYDGDTTDGDRVQVVLLGD